MCGFVGFTNKINDASIVLGKMMDRIKHRGPDSDGKYVDEQICNGFPPTFDHRPFRSR